MTVSCRTRNTGLGCSMIDDCNFAAYAMLEDHPCDDADAFEHSQDHHLRRVRQHGRRVPRRQVVVYHVRPTLSLL